MKRNRDLLRLILFLMSLGSSLYGLFLPIYYLKQGLIFNQVLFFLMAFCIGAAILFALALFLDYQALFLVCGIAYMLSIIVTWKGWPDGTKS